jgi:hypothetical protein
MSGGFSFGDEVSNSNDIGNNLIGTTPTSIICGTAHSYGLWTEIIASIPYDTQAISIYVYYNSAGYNATIQIGIGAAGYEQIIVQDWMAIFSWSGTYVLPISIPAGSRISVAGQSNSTGEHILPSFVLYDSTFTTMEGISGVDSMGYNAASNSGTIVTSGSTAGTKGSYSQIISATARDYCGIIFAVDGNNAGVNNRLTIDIAIGASGLEQIIVSNFLVFPLGIISGIMPIPILAGTRMAIRSSSSGVSITNNFTIYGLYQ